MSIEKCNAKITRCREGAGYKMWEQVAAITIDNRFLRHRSWSGEMHEWTTENKAHSF